MKKKIYKKPTIELITVKTEGCILAGSVQLEETVYEKSTLGNYEEIEVFPHSIGSDEF